MKVRHLAASDDTMEISGIYEASWRDAYRDIVPQSFLESIPKGKWVRHLENESMGHLVLEDDGRLIGTASFCASRWEQFSCFGEVVSIYLLPGHTGRGVGSLMLDACVSELVRSGFGRVMLWVLEDNHRARRFYEKYGFEPSGEYREDVIGGKALRELAYTFTPVQNCIGHL